MIKNLQDIFNTITPENIRNLPVMADAMEVFIEVLEEKCSESIDIRNVFKNPVIKNELYQVYLDDLYRTLNSVATNKHILDKIDEVNAPYNPEGMLPSDPDYVEFVKKDVISNIANYINDEQFLTFKSYKEHKGTIIAVKYIHELLNIFLDTTVGDNSFSIVEGDSPFTLEVIYGSLPGEFYEFLIRPLAHPLGFLYVYFKLVTWQGEDYFPEMQVSYDTDLLRVVCLQTDGSINYVDFIDKNSEPPLIDRYVTTIRNYNVSSARITQVTLDNGEYLKQTTTEDGQTGVELFDDSNILLETYVGQCSIEMVYTQIVSTTVQDDITNIDYSFGITSDSYVVPTDTIDIQAESETADEPQTHYECANGDGQNKWWDTIGEYFEIGEDDGYIYYEISDPIETLGESYFQLGIFDQQSDDEFDFGVWRGAERLADNNYAMWP